MRWVEIFSVLLDIRVQFVLGLVIIAIIVAVFLTFLESRIRRDKEKKIVITEENSYVSKIKKFAHSSKSPNEKLDFLDKISKEFFYRNFKTPLGSDFSSLVEHFEKTKRQKIANFCKSMFETYYLREQAGDFAVNLLYKDFIKIFEEIERSKKEIKVEVEAPKIKLQKKNERRLLKRGTANPFLMTAFASLFNLFRFKRRMKKEEFNNFHDLKDVWKENFKDVSCKKNSDEECVKFEKNIELKRKEVANRRLKKLKEEERDRISEVKKFFKKGGEEYMFYS